MQNACHKKIGTYIMQVTDGDQTVVELIEDVGGDIVDVFFATASDLK